MNAEEEKVELTIKQAEMICDKYCRMPYQTGNQEQLEDICWYCPINGGMGPEEDGCPELPSAQPDIIHCGECRYFTPKGNIESVGFGNCLVTKSVCLREDYCS